MTGAALGGTVTADVFAKSGNGIGVTVGAPGDRLALGSLGDLWHSPTVFATAASGTIPSTRSVTWTFSMPNDRAFVGQRLVWHAIAGSASGGYELSNPASSVHY